uniref:HhH-GPD domain-containing protein n=2 Tax=Manihot esculenta TaxID=3983 RepID=A0A2C9V8C4_MANES
MDTGKENQKELQVEDSWIPKTPLKPNLPTPQVIYTTTENELGLKGFSPGFSQESRDGRLSACLDSAANGNWKAALEAQKGITVDSAETCRGFPINSTAGCNFTSLLALQDQASATTTSAFRSNLPFINGNYSQESQCSTQTPPHAPAYDLNSPADGKATSCIFHLTLEKDSTLGCRQVTQVHYNYTDQRENQQRNVLQNETSISAVDTNSLQTGRELQKLAKDSLSTAVCTITKENHNPETPQQKPRRKKHRPKVVTEGRPRSRKPVTAKPASSTETPTLKRKYVRKKPLDNTPNLPLAESKINTTGKRRYVRKKPLNKASATPPVEAAGESINPKALDPANKSCRRSLNFDTQAKLGDDDSKCKPNANKDSQPQAQLRNQSKSTVDIGQGIEVIVKTTQACIACDLADSVNQMLKEYISLPEKQAPSAAYELIEGENHTVLPLPAKTHPPGEEQNDNSQESHAKEENQVTGTVQQKTTQIMLPADTERPSVDPDGSTCRTCTILPDEGKENGSKRKLFSSIQQPDSCSTNLSGIQYNSLPTYQRTLSSILKKKTEKGQNSAASGKSCMTFAKDIGRTVMTCPPKDARVDPSISTSNYLISAPCTANADAHGETGSLQSEKQNSGPNANQKKRSTKKRPRGPTQIQDLAQVTKMRGLMRQTYTVGLIPADYNVQQVEDSNRPHECIEALAEEMCGTLTTKRSKKNVSLINSTSSPTNWEQSHGKIILCNQSQFLAQSLGTPPEVIWGISHVDAIVEQLQHLNINRENGGIAYKEQSALVPYYIGNEQNALVLYRRDGTIIPFADSFVPIKKRRPRPKVYLDEETNKVWKLLMGNINGEGIDGTDEEKEKWWEEERKVFHGRANSFIARMHLVQGDRRFSQWKGSVVDSVIGVFLTQNVSDHLSSSAFMSLAARFPLKSANNQCFEERTSSVIEKPIACMPDLEEAIKWNGTPNQSICDQSSMTLHESELDEEQEVVNSNASSTSSIGIISSISGLETYYESKVNRLTTDTTKTANNGYTREKRSEINDAFSSQNSVISSQNSVDSPTAQAAERKESFSGNSEAEDLIDRSKFNSWNSSSSFMELLIKAGSNKLHEVQSHGYDRVFPDQNSKDECNKTQNAGNDFHMHKKYNVDCPRSTLEASAIPSNNCQSHLISNLGGVGFEYYEMFTEETRCYEISKNHRRNSVKEPSLFTSECTSQTTDENNMTIAAQEASISPTPNNPSCSKFQGKHTTTQTQGKLVEDLPIFSKSLDQMQNNEMQENLYVSLSNPGESLDIVESSSGLNPQQKNSPKTTEPDLIERGLAEIKETKEMNAATRKAKSRRVGKEIREHVDWDELRKQAEANEKKRQRTQNTMDSLDWEAVRCADVNEIANAIKERGMNNVLAERIKNFLNRLVREHGSIDLEWLRDVPPDKAKEYLLSIRGLGLKSVECVRLLTLHHLAFPVDTNVGRIAVRLGWVPLQPLPESLQLHLLELYPVLESIQKHLWPRLCKLDQRTLYELHYQMITFGKVFCTKSKPNCNACPMRGECRHFASAFASARLALPGPEEKGIVSATENRTVKQNPTVMSDQLPLPLPQATKPSEGNQQSESNRYLAVINCEPIVEEPSSPEPECPQVTEADMEDTFCEDPDEIPTIKLNIEEFTQNLQNYMQENMELQEGDMSKALVALTSEAASIPTPKLKHVSRLRTEHQVYELPDSHPLLQGLDRREPDDPCSYLLAIWTPGETANSIQPPESRCNSQEYGKLCDEKTCFSCNCKREANSQIVRGTLLIPCRTAMRGSFPLNGTYFQVNEVFADHDSSLNPIDVPRTWIWNLPRRTVYFGTSIPTIFKGLTTEGIQHCFWRGYVCVRGFDQKTRAPRPLIARLHFPASKLNKAKGKNSNDSQMVP